MGTGTNQEAVRRHNLGTLLRHVHVARQVTRADLTATMGLNRSTIGGLVTELETLGLVRQIDPSTGPRQSAGRPSAGVGLRDDGPYVVAVDLGVDRVVVARVGLGGRVLERARATLGTELESWQVGGTTAQLVRSVLAGAPAGSRLVGIGVSVPGLVRRSDGLVRLAPNLGWHDVSFGSILLAALGVDVPVSLANDADLGATAEHLRGAGIGVADLVYLSGNVGVGGGVIAGGHRLGGDAGYAGELGHLSLTQSDRACHCGSIGCWETEIGALAITQALGLPSDTLASLDEILPGLAGRHPELDRVGTHLGEGLAGIINVFNPRVVVLGGYLAGLYPLVRGQVAKALQDHALAAPLETVTLAVAGLGEDSVLLGAAELALEGLFADPVTGLSIGVPDAAARLAG